MEAFARRESFDGIDVGFQDANIALGEARGGPAALLQLLIAGGGARFDEYIADAELFDEAERFGAGAGADGEHADDRADTEDDAQSRKNAARFLREEVLAGLQSRSRAVTVHFCTDCSGLAAASFFLASSSGFERATSWPSFTPSMTARVSLRRRSLTSLATKLLPERT